VTALIIGALVAACALVFVLWPIFVEGHPHAATRARAHRTPVDGAPHDSAVRALREIEFDRATGKLADADYAALKTDYTARALAELRAASPAPDAEPTSSSDPAEALIAAMRTAGGGAAVDCPHCAALCTEPDAAYCSACGWYLAGECGKCGTAITEQGARFCVSCGWELAA
jgi:hypothetical protein